MSSFNKRDLYWILPVSLLLGGGLSAIQPGSRFIGWLGFSFLSLICFSLLATSTRWAGGGRTLSWMVVLAFALRFGGGVATYLILPINGYSDVDDQAGFVYTDAHRRDAQAWDLASSEHSVLDAFSRDYAYDQYGGLLSFSAFIYRYLSPDAHRPLMLVLLSGFMAALGLPFLFNAASMQWGQKIAIASGWFYALYPESVLIGGSALREPYLWCFSAFVLWGFSDWQINRAKNSWVWFGLGIAGMLLVSPVVALVTLVILAVWVYLSSERVRLPWWVGVILAAVFIAGLFLLSSALNRQGDLSGATPIGVINSFLREAVVWDVYQLERGSGWVQKLFDQMPEWLHLPFVMVYGVFQPVLPAILVEPTTAIWRVIGLLRAVGWYAFLPALILSFWAAAGSRSTNDRKLWAWLTLVVWGWIFFTALRGGGDQWDNPRYRAILFLWQAVLAGYVWVWWRETRSLWFGRVVLMECVFLLVFGQWYVNRYLKLGFQMQFEHMVVLIFALWAVIFAAGWLRDRAHRNRHGV